MAGEAALAALNVRDVPRAALMAAGGFALYALLLYTDVLSVLPGYPAVIVAFILWAVAPGWLLQRALVADRDAGPVEQTVLAFVMSMALAAAPGLLALRLHWSLDEFAIGYALLAAAASGVALLWQPQQRWRQDPSVDEPHAATSGTIPLLVLVAVPLLAIATSPWWAGDRIARDADDGVYMAFVTEYRDHGLDASEPLQDTSRGAFGRMQFNVWVGVQALLAESAGVEAFDLLLDYIPPIMTLLVVMAAYALAKGLFRSREIALVACLFVLLYGAFDLASHEGYGRNIFLRIGEDKMVASFIIVPLGVLTVARFLETPNVRTYAAPLLLVAALFVTHPMAVMLLGVASVSLVAVRMLDDRDPASLRSYGLLLAPWGIVALGLYLSAELGSAGGLSIGEPFRRSFHVVDVAGGMLVGSYHLILHPFMLAAILMVVPLWLLDRKSIGCQVLLASVGGALIVTFFPPVSSALGDAVNEEAIWRAHWLVPAPLILAYGFHRAMIRLRGATIVPRRVNISGTPALLAALGLVVASGYVVLEHYEPVDGGAFYNRTSGTALVPWTGGSIFLGGVERAFSSDWRPTGAEAGLLEYLKENAEPGSVVLVPPSLSSRYFAGVLGDIRPADYRGAPDIRGRRAFVKAYYDGTLDEANADTVLDNLSVDYVVIPPRSELNDKHRTFVAFEPGDFASEMGEPEIVELNASEPASRTAWAFASGVEERIGGQQFTVPIDIDPEEPTLEFLLELALTQATVGDQTARMVVTYVGDGGDVVSIVMDVEFSDGTGSAEPIIVRRPVAQPVTVGTTYAFIISRLPDAPEDTLEADVLLLGLGVKYWPEDLDRIGDSGFFIVDRNGSDPQIMARNTERN